MASKYETIPQKPRRKCPTPLKLPTSSFVAEADCPLTHLPIRKVGERLFIASYSAATDRSVLQAHQVTHILNLVGTQKCPNLYPEDFTYHTVSITDSVQTDLATALPKALAFIHAALRASGTVLVHCAMGKSRAPTVASAFLMWDRGLSFDQALAEVRKAQPEADPNLGFCAQLKQFTPVSIPVCV